MASNENWRHRSLIAAAVCILVAAGCQGQGQKPPAHGTAATEIITVADAIAAGDCAGLRRLLEGGASPNPEGPVAAPLVQAVAKGQLECARALLDAGADPDATRADGSSALQIAARANATELVALLLSRKASPELANSGGVAALAAAAGAGRQESILLYFLKS